MRKRLRKKRSKGGEDHEDQGIAGQAEKEEDFDRRGAEVDRQSHVVDWFKCGYLCALSAKAKYDRQTGD